MITRFDSENLEKNLPDAYRKNPESNNAKILAVEKSAIDGLRESVNAIYESLDIDNAYGKTLDLYGEMLGQLRGSATDEQYRILIKNRIVRNFANADVNGIINAICATFCCDPSEVLIRELEEPCKVSVDGLPITKLNESNIDINTALKIVKGLLPAGVYMESVSFAGTFEFSDTEMIYDEATGFADEAQTIGGYLGSLSYGSEIDLPV